jgi:hypothetical protein
LDPQNTLAVDQNNDEYPCFEVYDLAKDERFASLPVVDGTVAGYRFYAGTPITTDRGINIGSFFMFDDKPRPEGLSLAQRKCDSSRSCMRYDGALNNGRSFHCSGQRDEAS